MQSSRESYRSPVKQLKQQNGHSSTSAANDNLASTSPSPKCPLIPCMPMPARCSPGSAASSHPISELAGLHAALSSEGVQLGSPQVQPQSLSPLRSGLQQHNRRPLSTAATAFGIAGTLGALPEPDKNVSRATDLDHCATELQSLTARLASYTSTLQRSGEQSAGRLTSRDSGNPVLPGTTPVASPTRPTVKMADPAQISQLRDQLSLYQELVTKRAHSSQPIPAASAAAGTGDARGSNTNSSCHSTTEHLAWQQAASSVLQQQPPQQHQQQQQQEQELLGLGSSRSTAIAAALSAAVSSSQGPQRLLHQQQQQQLHSTKQLAEAGLSQLQTITEVSQLLQLGVVAHRAATTEASEHLLQLDRFFKAHPQYQDPAALQKLLDSKQQLEQAQEALRRQLQAKEQSLNSALSKLREQTSTPRDKRFAQLQHERSTLEQQLLFRDAAVADLQAEIRMLRDQLGQPQGSDDGELSPVKAEGQTYDHQHAAQVRAPRRVGRALWAGPRPNAVSTGNSSASGSTGSEGSSRGSSSSGSSRSCTPSSDDSNLAAGVAAQQVLQQQPSARGGAQGMTARYEQQRVAGLVTAQQVQHHLRSLRETQPRQPSPDPGTAALLASAPNIRPLSQQLSQPGTLEEALQHIDNLNAVVVRLQAHLQQQEQQAASLRASGEVAFKRQLEVEKKQHECTKQTSALLQSQLDQLQQQLGKSRAQQVSIQVKLDRSQHQLETLQTANDQQGNSSSSMSANAIAVSTLQQQVQRLQKHSDGLKLENKALQDSLHMLFAHIKGAGRLVGEDTVGATSRATAAEALGGNLMLQLEASVQRLLADVTSQQAELQALTAQKQQQQQKEGMSADMQELQVRVLQLQQANTDLQQQVDRLLSQKLEHKAEIRRQTDRLLQSEQVLLNLQDKVSRGQQLEQSCQQQQQELVELRRQLSTAQQDKAAAEGAAQECRLQLAASSAEKAVLMDRIRQLADRASAAESRASSGRSCPGSPQPNALCGPGMPPPALAAVAASNSAAEQPQLQQMLSAACAELNQQVAVLRGQLADSQAKEEQLHVANAQLQERLSKLQVAVANQSSASQGQPDQQHLEQLQQHSAAVEQQSRELQQQLEAVEQAKQQLQQQVDAVQQEKQHLQQQVSDLEQKLVSRAAEEPQQQQQQQQLEQQQEQQEQVEALQQKVQQLQMEVDERTQELQEWITHAEALETDVENLKERVLAADGLQQELDQTQTQLEARTAEQHRLQQELAQSRSKITQLEFELHGAMQECSALRTRLDATASDLKASRESSTDLRLRLDHLTGPAGPQTRARQLEASLQNVQRKYEAADARAASAAAQVAELTTKLENAEDEIVTLEGHISVLEEELGKYTQLPQ